MYVEWKLKRSKGLCKSGRRLVSPGLRFLQIGVDAPTARSVTHGDAYGS
jgi:hypothetical protein